jgi:hypothetical protein
MREPEAKLERAKCKSAQRFSTYNLNVNKGVMLQMVMNILVIEIIAGFDELQNCMDRWFQRMDSPDY